MHVRKGLRINLDGAAEFLRATIGVADGFIRERAVFGETVHEPGDVLVLCGLVGLPNGDFVRGHMTLLKRFEADLLAPMRRPPPGARAPVAPSERCGPGVAPLHLPSS